MHNTTALGRALNPVELNQSRYLDALHAFRLGTCLRMEDEPDAAAKAAADKAAADATAAATAKAAADKAAADAAAAKAADKGFPANTPISEMTADQRAAYFEDKARTEENRRKEMTRLTGGKYGDDLKADMEELARLRTEKMTDSEKAVETAKTQVRTEVAAEMAAENVRAAFALLLPEDMTAEQQEETLGVLNLTAFLTPEGKVDTAKVRTHAAKVAPAKDTGTNRDYGQGRRGTGSEKSGVSAGEAMFAARKKPITS